MDITISVPQTRPYLYSHYTISSKTFQQLRLFIYEVVYILIHIIKAQVHKL